MNNVNLIGRLVRDPDLKYTPSGTAVARFTLAVNRILSKDKREEAERNNQPTADFISCTAWNKTAETIANYVNKGHRIGINGRIQTGKYDDKDGKTVYTTDVVVTNMEFLESANNNNNYQSNTTTESNEGFYEINNDDIPF
ncbi:MAG: single-stranded DNA-binding protein [Peptoniphilus sp.]|uniref:single-stranded DNA-binding protein n=1 Tax=Peptoniphilus sp. TaxID=1971214 RepID=UPI002A7540E7|nr:single-stranded DNA-binding protein [Peptoniphilus sp.]MDY2986116.1 single-stranded DNA-binding protein [Peptoniphilus sp.]